MPSIDLIRASDGTGDATVATFTAARTPSATTCEVDSVAGYPQDFIATCGTPNIDTGIIESNIQVFVGHLSGSDIVIDAFAPGYSDTGNQVGDIIVIKPTTRTQDELADILDVSHEDDGTLNSAAMTQIAGSSTVMDVAAALRRVPRVSDSASIATLEPDLSDYDEYHLTAQAEALTIDEPIGTPVDGDKLLIRIKDDGTARAITWDGIFRSIGVTLPTTTVINKTLYIGCIYNEAAVKWDAIAVVQEA